MIIVPTFNGGRCGYFTEGRQYAARPVNGARRLCEVVDDAGNVRYVSSGPCPHIKLNDRSVGTWHQVAIDLGNILMEATSEREPGPTVQGE